jgi:hypothetical protein
MPFKNGIQFLFSWYYKNIETTEDMGVDSVEMFCGEVIRLAKIQDATPTYCALS